MMPGYLKNKLSLNLIIFAFVFLLTSSSFAQSEAGNKTVIQGNDTIVLEAVPLANITKNTEVVLAEINKITEQLKPDKRISSADSVYLEAVELLTKESGLLDEVMSISKRALDDALQQWTNYKNSLSEWQILIAERSKLLAKHTQKTDNLITIWKLTLSTANKEQAPQGIVLNIKDVINKLKLLKNKLREQVLQVYSIQGKLTELTIFIDETIKSIEVERKSIRTAFFKQDSPPIWNAYDSTSLSSMTGVIFINSAKETSKALTVFYKANSDKFYIHILIFILLITLLSFLQKHAIILEASDELIVKAKKVLNNYVLSGLILGFIATIWVLFTAE